MATEHTHENYENLTGEEAVKQLQEIVDHEAICMFHTALGAASPHVRPMGVQQVCDQGNFWLFSARASEKNADIAKDDRVMLTIAVPGRSQFLVVQGKAEVRDDQAKKDELWNNLAKAWFPEGKEDPELTVIKVVPTESYYWDTKDGRMLSMVKIAVAAVTGNMNDSGSVQGKIAV